MDFSVFLPVLDSLSKAMEAIPNPWIAASGVVLAGLVYLWRARVNAAKDQALASQTLAEVIAFKPAQAPAAAPAEAKAQAIVDATLKGDK